MSDKTPKTFYDWTIEEVKDGFRLSHKHKTYLNDGRAFPLLVETTGANVSEEINLETAKLAALEEDVRTASPDDRDLWIERRDKQLRYVSLGRALRPIVFGNNSFSSSIGELERLNWVSGEAAPGIPKGEATYDTLMAAGRRPLANLD